MNVFPFSFRFLGIFPVGNLALNASSDRIVATPLMVASEIVSRSEEM